jgi:hypothetical protein
MKTNMPLARFLIFFLLLLPHPSFAGAEAGYTCVEGNCDTGKGKLLGPDGASFLEGEFWNGTLIKGKAVFSNGDVFEGLFDADGLAQGEKYFQKGTVMKGDFKKGILVNGTITHPDGRTFPVQLRSNQQRMQVPLPTPPPSNR